MRGYELTAAAKHARESGHPPAGLTTWGRQAVTPRPVAQPYDYSHPLSVVCSRCGLENKYWPPLGTQSCRRCRLLLLMSAPAEPLFPLPSAKSVGLVVAVLVFLSVLVALAGR